jgi:hypothetical protein
MITPSSEGSLPNGSFTGVADSDQFGTVYSAAAISGIYNVQSNGYGGLTIENPPALGAITTLGIYVTDPNINLNDPNNPSGGGGALVADLDAALFGGGTGVLVPQTDTTAASFAGNYAFGGQNYNDLAFWEFDFVGQGSVTSGALSGTGLVNDPGSFWDDGSQQFSGTTFSGTPQADGSNPGRYSMLSTNETPNPLVITAPIPEGINFNVAIYQASGGQLFWMEEDDESLFLGPIQQQGSLTGLPAAKKPAAQTQTKQKP